MDVVDIEIDLECFPNPGEKSGKYFSAQLVSVAKNRGMTGFVDGETGVGKSPVIRTFNLIGTDNCRFGIDQVIAHPRQDAASKVKKIERICYEGLKIRDESAFFG